jgi:hypothetical protein
MTSLSTFEIFSFESFVFTFILLLLAVGFHVPIFTTLETFSFEFKFPFSNHQGTSIVFGLTGGFFLKPLLFLKNPSNQNLQKQVLLITIDVNKTLS